MALSRLQFFNACYVNDRATRRPFGDSACINIRRDFNKGSPHNGRVVVWNLERFPVKKDES